MLKLMLTNATKALRDSGLAFIPGFTTWTRESKPIDPVHGLKGHCRASFVAGVAMCDPAKSKVRRKITCQPQAFAELATFTTFEIGCDCLALQQVREAKDTCGEPVVKFAFSGKMPSELAIFCASTMSAGSRAAKEQLMAAVERAEYCAAEALRVCE